MHPTRTFKTPDELFAAWESYKGSLIAESKKWPKIQYVGKDGGQVIDYPKLPLTLEGFNVWAFKQYGLVKHYFLNQDGLYSDFIAICSHIREEIRHDQITGGMLGEYNPSITQRLNGLTEKTQTEITIEQSPFKSLMLDVPTDNSTK